MHFYSLISSQRPTESTLHYPPPPRHYAFYSIWQGAATGDAHNYRPGSHLYSWVERVQHPGTICVNILPKDAVLSCGKDLVPNPWTVDCELRTGPLCHIFFNIV